MAEMADGEARALLLRAGIEAPDPALVARMAIAAAKTRAGVDRQPRDLPAGLEPAIVFAEASP